MIVFRYLKALVRAGIPSEYWYLDLDKLNIDVDVLENVKEYIGNIKSAAWQGIGLMFLGPNGIGKTSCQCIIGEYAVVSGFRVSYLTLSQYIQMFQENSDAAVRAIQSTEFLLLDELDKAYMKSGSDYVSKKLFELLGYVGAPGPALITCTNWQIDEIKTKFGISILSKLKRRVHILEIEGEDYSERIQENLLARLKRKIDYKHPAILKMANLMEEHSWKHGN